MEFCKAWYHKFCEATYFRSEETHLYTLQQNNPAYYGVCLTDWWDYTHPGSKSLGSTLMVKHDYQFEIRRLCWNTRTIVLLEKVAGSQPVKKFPAFYGTRMFITAFTSACHLSLSWARSVQFMPTHLISWRAILILCFYLCLGLPSSLFPSGFPTKTLYTHILAPIYATFPANLILLDLITRSILGEYRLRSCSFLHYLLPRPS